MPAKKDFSTVCIVKLQNMVLGDRSDHMETSFVDVDEYQ